MNLSHTIVSLVAGLLLPVGATALEPTAQVDTAPPLITRSDSCGAREIFLEIRDTASTDDGLRVVRLVASQPDAVSLVEEVPVMEGDTLASVRVHLNSGFDESVVTVVAEDLAGNADSVTLRLLRRSPTISTSRIELLDVGQREDRTETITLTNGSTDADMRVDEFRFTSGAYFDIRDIREGSFFGLPLEPGESAQFTLTFGRGVAREYSDTLIVTIDCLEYQIPLRATLGTARLSVENLDFWQVLIGTESCLMFPISNPGTDTTYISAIEILGGEYRFDTTAIPFLPDRIPPGATIEIPICFFPRRLGLLLGTVTFLSSAADTQSVTAQLAGIGVNSFTSVGFDSEGKLLQISVVPSEEQLTVVSADRSRDLSQFRLFNLRGEEIPIRLIELVGRGWWQIETDGRLIASLYYLQAIEEGKEPLVVKFVVLE